jgi:hypothetical protein
MGRGRPWRAGDSRAGGQGYPTDTLEILAQDQVRYGSGSCPLGSAGNWLYRVGAPGTYTFGYWVDWRLAKHVCLHTSGPEGWSCGFGQWGPFPPAG